MLFREGALCIFVIYTQNFRPTDKRFPFLCELEALFDAVASGSLLMCANIK